jgi:UDP-3-O-[3-hydroxymyristoyl] glucosamine N-acyltransferase
MKNRSFPRRLKTPTCADALLRSLQDAAHDESKTLTLRGNPSARIDSIANPSDAEPGSLIFCRAMEPARFQALLESTRASVIFAPGDAPLALVLGPEQALLTSADPLANFIRAVGLFELLAPSSRAMQSVATDEPGSNGPIIAPSATIAPGVTIGEQSFIGSETVIGAGTMIGRHCQIGAKVTIGQHCTLEDGTVVGDGAFIQHSVVIGSIGLGYHFTAAGERLLFPHLGIVIVGEQVVIGSGSVIVRGQLDDTQLGRAVRLGNLVNIGHNVKLGDDCALSSGVVVAGGTSIGPRCNIGIGAMVNAKIQLGSDCQVGMASVVTKSLNDGSSVFGNPARALPTMGHF